MKNPQLSGSNPCPVFFQKAKAETGIRKGGGQRGRRRLPEARAQKTAQTTKKTAEASARRLKSALPKKRKKPRPCRPPLESIAIVGGIFLGGAADFRAAILFALFSGGGGAVAASTYEAEDADMLAAEAAYCGMEAELQN